MRGIDRLLAAILLAGAVGGVAVFTHGLGTDDAAAPLTFAGAPPAAPPALRTVRIALPPAPRQRLLRPAPSAEVVSPTQPRIVLSARSSAPRVVVTPVSHLQRVVVHVTAPKPSAPPKPSPPVRTPAAPPAIPPTQLAHVKVPLTPTDPSRILATAPVPLTPTPPVVLQPDGGQTTSDTGNWSAHGNGHGHGHAD